jgi:hypothetical protein
MFGSLAAHVPVLCNTVGADAPAIPRALVLGRDSCAVPASSALLHLPSHTEWRLHVGTAQRVLVVVMPSACVQGTTPTVVRSPFWQKFQQPVHSLKYCRESTQCTGQLLEGAHTVHMPVTGGSLRSV